MSQRFQSRSTICDENAGQNTILNRKPINGPQYQMATKSSIMHANGIATKRAALGDISGNQRSLIPTSKRPLAEKRTALITKPIRPPAPAKDSEEDVTMRDTTADIASAKKISTAIAMKTPLSSKMADVETFSDEEIEQDLIDEQEEQAQQTKRRRLEFDELHSRNAQYVGDYVNEIFDHLRSIEPLKRVNPNYMSRQTDITARMREILIDWLIEVHAKFQLAHETLYLTVSIIDRFLERRAVSRNKLQLVGCTAMLLASKYEEIYAPEVMDFVHIADKAYTREQILGMEGIMLNALKFELTTPSMYRFAERYGALSKHQIKSVLANMNDIILSDGTTSISADKIFDFTLQYFCELTLQEYKYLIFSPSQIVCAALVILHSSIQQHSKEVEIWDSFMIEQTRYYLPDLLLCVNELLTSLSAANVKYRAVRKKFSQKKWGEVSKKDFNQVKTVIEQYQLDGNFQESV